MSIRAPYQCLHFTPYPEYCYEREIFFETLGACWALSARNTSGMFPIQLRLDLSKINLLYGVPSSDLPPELLARLINLFKARPKGGFVNKDRIMESNAIGLIREMNKVDFLSFSMGFQDAVEQVLTQCSEWSNECQNAYMALKFTGMNLAEHSMNSLQQRHLYADLLLEYLLTSQKALVKADHRDHLNF